METENQNPKDENAQQEKAYQSHDEYPDPNPAGQPNGAIPDKKRQQQYWDEDQETDESNIDEEKNPNDLSDPDNPGNPEKKQVRQRKPE